MRALITGGMGFAGTHLSRHLADCRDDVAITYLPKKSAGGEKSTELKKLDELRLANIPKQAQHVALDVTNEDHLNQILSLMKPDVIYHLAGIPYVASANEDTDHVFKVNTFGTKNLLEAVKSSCPKARVLVVSSAEVYGIPRVTSQAFTETSELRPVSFYGASKAAAEMISHGFVAREGLEVVLVRPFAHVGPFQEDTFSLSSFAKQIAEIKLGKKEPILEVGNIEVKRDFSDVSDIVRGYRECALNGRVGEVYNLCSGQSFLLQDLIETLIKISGVSIEVKVRENRLRAIDIPEYFGNFQKAQKEIGWKPRIEKETFLAGLFSYWLEFLDS